MLLKIALVVCARRFAIRPAYDEWRPGKWDKERGYPDKVYMVHGEEAYQTENGGTHPALAYPARVELVNA